MSTTANENVLTFERVINAPRALVWQAWTDPKHAAQWWGPAGCSTSAFESDLRPGGRLHIELAFAGTIGIIEAVYEEVVELERLVTVGSLARDGVRLLDTRRVVTFEENGGKTKVTVQQSFYNVDELGADSVAGAREGLKQQFDRLEEYLLRISP
jgi:uncharacterized protein YndB with AHSA1/START domain